MKMNRFSNRALAIVTALLLLFQQIPALAAAEEWNSAASDPIGTEDYVTVRFTADVEISLADGAKPENDVSLIANWWLPNATRYPYQTDYLEYTDETDGDKVYRRFDYVLAVPTNCVSMTRRTTARVIQWNRLKRAM